MARKVRLQIEVTDQEAGMIIEHLREKLREDPYTSTSKKRKALINRIWLARWEAGHPTPPLGLPRNYFGGKS